MTIVDILLPLWSIISFGFMGSLHCIGMCGPLVATCTSHSTKYFVARSLSYTILGLIAGLLGTLFFVKFLNTTKQTISLVFALVVLCQIIFIFSNQFKLKAQLSQKFLTKIMMMLPFSRATSLGIVTALLPCGFLYMALAMSSVMANIWLSALSMFLFACVTTPALWGGRVVLQKIAQKYVRTSKIILAVLLLVTAFFFLKRGGWFSPAGNSDIHARPSCH